MQSPTNDPAAASYRKHREEFWDSVWETGIRRRSGAYYRNRLHVVYRQLAKPNLRVLEIGTGTGDLLAALQPSRGLGIDFSEVAIETARRRHPTLEFVQADAHDLDLDETFDVVVISETINDAWDVQKLLQAVRSVCTPETRVILNFFNRAWQVPVAIARKLGLAQPLLRQNWLSVTDIRNLLSLSGFEVVSVRGEILLPLRVPFLNAFFDRFLVKLWPFSHLAMTHFVVARPDPKVIGSPVSPDATVTVVVPARNEAGHIREILERIPRIGGGTEIILVEGNSTDGTYDVIEEVVRELGNPDIRYFRQPGVGKGDAVRAGFSVAGGDILMILDADMTVAPEDLPRFFEALVDGRGEFINGVRLVYPMEDEAMQFLNYLGNKFFGVAFSWLLAQPVKDTLCGTKVMTQGVYQKIVANRAYFGDFDPFGDFDLLFGAARLNLKIVDLPIRYRQRRYGSTNIDRWRHGLLLLRMAAFAARKLRLI
jgi:SAM-dependent methyltransferase